MLRNTLLYISSITFLFLISFFSLPFTGWDADSSKVTLLLVWAVIAVIVSVVEAFVLRSWRVPFKTTLIGITSILTFLVLLSSAFFSQVSRISFFGDGYTIGTPLFLLVTIGLSYIVSKYARDSRRSGSIFLAILGGVTVATTISCIAIILRAIFGFSQGTSAYLFGLVSKWNDLGVYASMLLIACVFAIRSFVLNGVGAVIVYGVSAISLIILAAVNLVLVWTVICIVSIILLISIRRNKSVAGLGQKKFIWMIGVLALISSLFMLDNHFTLFKGNVAGLATRVFDVSSVEAYPSFSSTVTIAQQVLAQSPLFGFGPGRFSDAWRMYRPQGVNLSQFWSTEFTYGVGLWPTFIITSGIIGGLGVLVLLLVILLSAYKLYRKPDTTGISAYINKVVALIVIFSTFIFCVYGPGLGATLIYAAFVGLLVGLSYRHASMSNFEVSFFTRWNILGLGTLLIVVGVACGSLWVYGAKIYAAYNYNNAIIIPAADTASLYKISGLLEKAFSADHRDMYARVLASTYYAQFNNLLVASSSSYNTSDFQGMLNAVINASGNAVIANPFNAQNYIFVAELFRSLASQGVTGANEQAQSLYRTGRTYEQYNPFVPVLEARLALQSKDTSTAKTKLEEAIALKPNYTEAVFLLSQLLIDKGGSKDAITQLEARSKFAPVEPIVFFQLGFLKYASKDYIGAISALEAAVSLVPDYSNALYFLGLSYYRQDRNTDAIAAFERVVALNPDSTEASSILNNLKAGKAPLTTTAVTPEKRSKLPVNEKSKTQEE